MPKFVVFEVFCNVFEVSRSSETLLPPTYRSIRPWMLAYAQACVHGFGRCVDARACNVALMVETNADKKLKVNALH